MSSERRQRKALQEKKKMQEEQQKAQLRASAHQQNNQQNLQDSHGQFEQQKAQYLDKLMDTNMTDAGINLLDNMVDQSFILGNITEAEYHDIKWEMHGMYLKIKSNFPPEESAVTGDVRAFILNDADEKLKPLTSQQRTIIAQMIRGVTMLVSRSKGGFQQEMNVKSISVSEVMEPEKEQRKSRLGLFSK